MIPDSFKQDLLNRVDVTDVVGRYVQLKKAGANLQGLCPFHTEKSPSFTVSPVKQFYHCFGCGAHGNAIGFLMAYSNLGYVDAIKELAGQVGMQVPEWQPSTPEAAARKERETDLLPMMEKAMDFYRSELKKSPRAIEYLKGRGLSGEVAARFGIGYAPDDWQALKNAFPSYDDKALVETGLVIANEGKRYDRFRDRVMFPIFSARGTVIGFGGRVLGEGEPKYLNSPETPLFEKGRELYGVVQARDAIRDAGRVLVVEGYMDVVALAQFGVGYAVATLGTATTAIHVSKLLRLADELVFCFDGDAAGRKAAWRALEVSLPLASDAKPIKFLFLPEKDDPDSYIRAHGQEGFERLVHESSTLSEFLISELRSERDLRKPEGRAGFLVAAKGFLEKLTAPALRMQLLREFASLAQVSAEDVERLIQPAGGHQFRKPSPHKRPPAHIAAEPEQHLLRCVLVNPKLIDDLKLDLLNQDLPETGVLRFIAGKPSSSATSASAILDYFQGAEFERVVADAQLMTSEFQLEAELVGIEFNKVYLQLRIRKTNEKINDLKQRSQTDPHARQELASTLQELHQLNSQRKSASV